MVSKSYLKKRSIFCLTDLTSFLIYLIKKNYADKCKINFNLLFKNLIFKNVACQDKWYLSCHATSIYLNQNMNGNINVTITVQIT